MSLEYLYYFLSCFSRVIHLVLHCLEYTRLFLSIWARVESNSDFFGRSRYFREGLWCESTQTRSEGHRGIKRDSKAFPLEHIFRRIICMFSMHRTFGFFGLWFERRTRRIYRWSPIPNVSTCRIFRGQRSADRQRLGSVARATRHYSSRWAAKIQPAQKHRGTIYPTVLQKRVSISCGTNFL